MFFLLHSFFFFPLNPLEVLYSYVLCRCGIFHITFLLTFAFINKEKHRRLNKQSCACK